MERKASVVWRGGFGDGNGQINTESGALEQTRFTCGTRFEGAIGTNPEELVAAAHAACFSMALAHELERLGYFASIIQTDAVATFQRLDEGWRVTDLRLTVDADVPQLDPGVFEEIAQKAKTNCPISKLLNANIRLDAGLRLDDRPSMAV